MRRPASGHVYLAPVIARRSPRRVQFDNSLEGQGDNHRRGVFVAREYLPPHVVLEPQHVDVDLRRFRGSCYQLFLTVWGRHALHW